MANKNNKGFSLIEIVIAMAVLTLLLTPIIKQFAQTMRVSRQAKEQQYINEEASYSLEEAQVTPKEQYVEKYIEYVDANPELTFRTSTDAVQCTLVDSSGNEISLVDGEGNPLEDAEGNTVNYVEYKVESYVLGNVKIGTEKATYDKVTTVDNLSTMVRGCKNMSTDKGLSIKYNMTQGEVPVDYTLTNEGCAVKRDGNGNVISVVVEETDYVGNPNETNLGNMQNLDYETVAMINGTAANFDDQAEKALFSMAMDQLKEINYEEWELGMLHSSGDNILLQHGYAPTMTKLTKVYIDKLTDAENKEYYLVKADVYYDCWFTLDGQDATADLSYNVFSQKFYTKECPNVYFEYQPFITDMVDMGGGSYDVTYASNDYILVDNYVKGAKIYIYKPHMDAVNVSVGANEGTYEQKEYYSYTTVAPDEDDLASESAYEQFVKDHLVTIHVANANDSVKSAETKIFTNLDLNVYDSTKSQFAVSASEFTTFIDIKSDRAEHNASNFVDFEETNILSIDDDTRYDDRLRTVTVTLLPIQTDSDGNVVVDASGKSVVRDDANTVILTGAKGEK